MKRSVLFLCTGNSCRSQMAEGWLRHLAGEVYEVNSAGTNPASVNPRAIDVMAEVGVDISRHRSKRVEEFLNQRPDYVITVCDRAKEACPTISGGGAVLHWSFDDPAEAQGSDDIRLGVFRRVRDEIADRIKAWLRTEAHLAEPRPVQAKS